MFKIGKNSWTFRYICVMTEMTQYMKEYRLQIVSDHLLIESEGGLVLVDTGSPMSFHKDGVISLCGDAYNVPRSLMNVNAAYVSDKVGTEVSELLGMDIIGKYDTLIDVHQGTITFGCNLEGCSTVPSFTIQGCIGVYMLVDGKEAKVFVDTGAPTSYIGNSFTNGKVAVDTVSDFSPMASNETFETPVYELSAEFAGKAFTMKLGNLPGELAMMLSFLGADGAVGMELLKRFPIIISKGQVYIHP